MEKAGIMNFSIEHLIQEQIKNSPKLQNLQNLINSKEIFNKENSCKVELEFCETSECITARILGHLHADSFVSDYFHKQNSQVELENFCLVSEKNIAPFGEKGVYVHEVKIFLNSNNMEEITVKNKSELNEKISAICQKNGVEKSHVFEFIEGECGADNWLGHWKWD